MYNRTRACNDAKAIGQELLYYPPNRLLHVTSRDLEKPGSECDLTTLVRRLGVTTSMKKACNREIRSFHCASVMSVIIHSDLVKKLETPSSCLEFCRAHGLIARDRFCDVCGQSMRLANRQGGKKSSDCFSWRCTKKGCGKERSIRTVTWFDKSRLTIRQIVEFT